MAVATLSELTDRVGKLLNDNNYDPGTVETAILTDAVTNGLNAVKSILTKRGYTAAQIASWSRLKEYHIALGMCDALMNLGYRRQDKQNWSMDFCKRAEELMEIELLDDADELISPGNSPAIGVALFDLEEINQDLDVEF